MFLVRLNSPLAGGSLAVIDDSKPVRNQTRKTQLDSTGKGSLSPIKEHYFLATVVTSDHHFASFKESPAGTFSPVLLPLPNVLILLPFH